MLGVGGTVLSGRWSQDKSKLKRTSNFSPSNQRKPCPLKITRRYAQENASGVFFLFPKRSFPSGLIPDQECLLINTLSNKQGLSKIQKQNLFWCLLLLLPFIMSAGARGSAGAPRITA